MNQYVVVDARGTISLDLHGCFDIYYKKAEAYEHCSRLGPKHKIIEIETTNNPEPSFDGYRYYLTFNSKIACYRGSTESPIQIKKVLPESVNLWLCLHDEYNIAKNHRKALIALSINMLDANKLKEEYCKEYDIIRVHMKAGESDSLLGKFYQQIGNEIFDVEDIKTEGRSVVLLRGHI